MSATIPINKNDSIDNTNTDNINKTKVSSKNSKTLKEYRIITKEIMNTKKFNKYTIPEIKYSLKHYEIKFKSNIRKQDLYNLLNSYLFKSEYVNISNENKTIMDKKSVILQKNIRRFLIRNKIKKYGLGIYNISKCNNECDPFTLNDLEDIPNKELIVYYDKDDDKYYGFEILSIYDLFYVSNKYQNPFNQKDFSEEFINNFKYYCKNNKRYLPNMKNDMYDVIDYGKSIKIKKLEDRTFNLFHKFHITTGIPNIDFNYYFKDLNINMLVKFYAEMVDLWNYRVLESQSPEVFHQKYIPSNISIFNKNKQTEIDKIYYNAKKKKEQITVYDSNNKLRNDNDISGLIDIHNIILSDLEDFYKYPKEEDKTTVIFWILTVLTEINLKAAETLGQFLVF